MSTTPVTPEDRARDYIDSIVAINLKYGMQQQPLSAEEYDRAVSAATQVYSGAHRVLGRATERSRRPSP